MELKYIIFDNEFPVIFTKSLNHKDFIVTDNYSRRKITSAGFCSIHESKETTDYGIPKLEVTIYGESISLKIKSTQSDKQIIEMILNER